MLEFLTNFFGSSSSKLKQTLPPAILFALAFTFTPATHAHAQTPATPAPIIPPTPIVPPNATPAPAGPTTALELSARRALDIGLPSIAAQIYQQLLAPPASSSPASPASSATLTPDARNRIILALATALIQDDRDDEAAKVLQQFTAPPNATPPPALQLRQAMLDARVLRTDAAYATRIAAARATAAALHPEDLTPEDKSWLLFLRGFLAQQARDNTAATTFYQQAAAAAVSDIQRAWFELARQRARLFLGEATEASLAPMRQAIERNAGRPLAYANVSQLAIALNTLHRPAEAVTLLQNQLQLLAPQETTIRDEWQILLGMIASPETDAGRAALRDLLTNSTDRDKQRAALRLLAAAATRQNRLPEFRQLIDQLIAATPPHPITGSLLLFRAQLSLADKTPESYAAAEADANRFLTDYPGSVLRPTALGILAASAWEQGRYRAAAAQAAAAQTALPDTPENKNTIAQLALLIAESYFRAGDYRNASDAYGIALDNIPAGVSPGMLMFQRVLAEIQASDLAAAQQLLDKYSDDSRFDPLSRWQAEWNLARALQSDGQTAQAYARVNHLLAAPPTSNAALPQDMRVRMSWLQARLAYDSGDYAQTIALSEKLLPALATTDPELSSLLLLLEAQAHIALNPDSPTLPPAAAAIFKRLRVDYPKNSAAIYSYIIEADAAARRGQLVEAQDLLTKLADSGDKDYAPYALYEAALYSERRGDQAQYYRDAYIILERIATGYKDSPLYFYARLKQGNLLRNLNDYGAALNLYADLVNNPDPANKYPQKPDAFRAELALADTHAALATTDPTHAESAATIYERLLDFPDQKAVPPALRIEAGYKYGLSLIARDATARLETIWWQMIKQYLLDDTAPDLDGNARYWMSRALLKLGEVLEQQNRILDARELYELLIRKNLPGVTLAQARLNPPAAGSERSEKPDNAKSQ